MTALPSLLHMVTTVTPYLKYIPAIIGIGIIAWNSIRSVGSFVNPKEVFMRYVVFFYDANAHRLVEAGKPKKRKILWGQFLIYFVSPLLFGFSLALTWPINKELIETLLVVVSLIDATLFSVYGIFPPVLDKIHEQEDTTHKERKTAEIEHKLETIRKTGDILNFEILISVVLIAFCFAAMICAEVARQKAWVLIMGSVIIYGLALMLFFNLLIVLKRYARFIEELIK